MNGLPLLVATAVAVAAVHTVLGPDHYLPFVVISRARGWSARRTATITLACGAAHVLSSLALGTAGIALGVAATRLAHVESVRGELAAWGLIAVGLAYGGWGLRQAMRGTRHVHLHPHPLAHAHVHDPAAPHTHAGHVQTHDHGRDGPSAAVADGPRSLTPWMLFLIFVLGPCEPLIPLLMVPAVAGSVSATVLVAFAFGATTLVAMLAAVTAGRAGTRLLPLGRFERYTHALAGAAILVSGLGIALLGW